MIERGILYIVDSSTNSMRQHVLTLLKYLNRARYKPYLVVSGDDILVEHAKKLKVDYVTISGIKGANKLNLGGVSKQIEDFISEHPANLIHSHGFQACYVGAQVAKALNIPHVSTIHSTEGLGQKKGLLGISNDKIATMPDRLIAVSEVVKKNVEALNKVNLIYNGIEADRFAETLDVEHLFRELELPKENILVGTISRLSPEKGTSVFLEAAAALIKQRPSIHCIVVGDGDELDSLKKKVASLGIDANTHFLGFRRDVAHILKSLNIVVIPNLSPGLPMILLEALASLRAVVLSDVPGVREVVSEDSVLFVPPGNAVAITEAVSRYLDDHSEIYAKARTGQSTVTEKYTIKNMMRPTESLYLELAR